MSKILMITGEYVEDYENMVPYQALIAEPPSIFVSTKTS